MRWRRWTESLLNEALRAPATVWKARFLVECLLVGVLASSAFVVLLFATGHYLAAIATVAGDVAFVLCLAALKRVKRYDVVAHVGLAVCLGVFGIPSVTERELDAAILAWTCVVPYIAALILPTRRALFWGAVSLGAIAFVLVLRGPGTGAAPDMLVSTARVVALVATVFVFGIRFAQEQGSALSELSSANRAKSAFLATMSHEIRTPMNGVLGITEVLLSGPLDVETREKLNLVRESGHTLVALINDILDFSKVEAGKLTVEAVDFDLRLLVDDVAGLQRANARLKGVGFEVTVDQALPQVVQGDSLRLKQVLTNLLSNAVKFTERGEVRFHVEGTPAGLVRFTVSDTGIGISRDAIARLFTPFEQADGSTTRRFGGSGLGLALSQNLVRLLGGTITVESVPQVGSRFWFEVKLPTGVMALAREPLEAETTGPRSDLPVLVVDDNVINLKVACSLVEKAGYRTRTAPNGQVAWEMVQAEPFLMVLMDCHMPVMDGFEATEKIRGLETDAAMTPIVALTASALPEELEACRRSGMNECLTKPVSLQALKAVLRRIEHYRGILEGAA